MTAPAAAGEDTRDAALRRLRWQCRRGMLELDLLLQGFLDREYPGLEETDQSLFGTLLDYPDQILYEWLMQRSIPTDGRLVHVIEKIRQAAVV